MQETFQATSSCPKTGIGAGEAVAITLASKTQSSISPSRRRAVLGRPTLPGDSSFALPSEYNRLRGKAGVYNGTTPCSKPTNDDFHVFAVLPGRHWPFEPQRCGNSWGNLYGGRSGFQPKERRMTLLGSERVWRSRMPRSAATFQPP